ncbi:hypothetical protein JW887_02725, partial [Candidatus Dojkabacteria bacterium]|nr:hypothetical protein [Candidatus Dojkabacteria bacterium]
DNMTQIVRFLNACGNPNFSFAALEMRRFHSESTEILVPRVDGDFRKPQQKEAGTRFSWNKELIIKDAKEKLSLEAFLLFENLFSFCEQHSQAGMGYGTGKENGSFTFYGVRDSVKGSLFSVFSHGDFVINLGYMQKIYSDSEIDGFKKSLSQITPIRNIESSDKWFYIIKLGKNISKLEDVEAFKKIVLEFLQNN